MEHAKRRIAAALLALFVLSTACATGDDDEGDGRRSVPESPTTAAADLRVTLDILFREHVFLLGYATENGLNAEVEPFQAAVEVLEENALALADQFDKAYGGKAEKEFLKVWRPYMELMSSYATRRIRQLPKARIDKAFAQGGSRFAAFAGSLTPLISPRVMSARMRDLIGSIRAAIDAQVAKDFAKAGAALRTASDRAADMAAVFARAFADDIPVLFGGDPLSPAASLRASLSAAMTQHVYFLGATVSAIVTKQSRARDGAKGALDASAATLAKQIGASYGANFEKSFLPLWKRQADLLISYAGSDKAKREKAQKDLEQYATDAAGFLAGLNSELDEGPLEAAIDETVKVMTQAIDAQLAGDFRKADLRLRAAAARIETIAEALAEATVKRFPSRFPSTPSSLPG